jgi:hypothetical protein
MATLRCVRSRGDSTGCELGRFAVGADEFAAAEAKESIPPHETRDRRGACAHRDVPYVPTAPQSLRIEPPPGVAC